MKKKTIIILLILTLAIYASNINVQITAEENDYRPTSLELSPHGPIEITSDSDFEVFPGTGTEVDPYVIEGYNITTTSYEGISITGTTKYFIVSNCYVDAEENGISIEYVADGTATVISNTCSNNLIGIELVASDSSTIANNTCCNNIGDGIYLHISGSATVANNTCNNNDFGIHLGSSGSATVANNTCNNNVRDGICLWSSIFCVVTYNLLQENERYGVYLRSGSDINLIHHNTFVDNNLGGTSQAYDDSTNNFWYNSVTQEGNYWSDWSGTGSYSIDGSANSVDLYPLEEPVIVEYPQIVLLTLLLSIVPLILTRTISKRTKKK